MSENRGGFIQRIRFEDKVLELIATCNTAFAEGDRKIFDNAVSALHSSLYAIPDVQGLDDLEDEIELIEQSLKKTYDEKMILYKEECAKAQCPDVITKPKLIMRLTHIDAKYREILRTLGKNNITLTSKNVVHF